MKTNLHYIIQKPLDVKATHPLILLMHGYGSNEEDLFSFAPELDSNAFIVSVRAPYAVPPYGHAWYAINFDAQQNKFSDDNEAIQSRDLLVDFIDYLIETYPIDPKQVQLVGFSQGAILSYAVALSYPEKINKVVALSGYFNENILLPHYKENDFTNLRFFASHGSVDQVIDVEWARKTPGILDGLSIANTYKEYPVGHGVHPLNFQDFKVFLETK